MFEALFKYDQQDFARSELIFAGDWPGWLLLGLLFVASAGIAAFLYTRRAGARWYQLVAIGATQLAMVALVLVLLQQPTLVTDRLREGENTVAVVLDHSASMNYGQETSRFGQASAALSMVLEGDDAPDMTVRHYRLGAAATAMPSFLESAPDDSSTAIAASLRSVLDAARFDPLAAVIVGSDGADTDGGLSADELAELAAYGVPIHTIGVGRASMPDDVELESVVLPNAALPGSTISARLTIRHDAQATTNIKVYDGDELLTLEPVELAANAESTTAWVDVTLDDPGPHELHFAIDAIEGETESRNNRRSRLVNVDDEQYRVLYVEGEPRWEYKFLRRAVAGDDDLSVATLLRVSPNKFYRQGIDTPEQLADGFPTARDELFAYDALIVGSVEAASLTVEQQEIIRDFVSERGGSLLMLAGPSGLGNGGWGQSAIADVLPARLSGSATDTFHRKKAGVVLTPQGAASQLLKLDADDTTNRAAWSELPEVADYQVLGDLKPATVTLLNANTDLGEQPLLVAQPYGNGNAYILATGGTWRWQMSMPLENQSHETFWRQLMRTMVASAPDNVSLTISGGEGGYTLRAEFRDEAFLPVDDVGVTLVASHEDGYSESLALEPGEDAGVFIGDFQPSQSGTWYFEALAERDGEPVAVGRTSLLFESGQAEHFGIRANAPLLQRLSAATGGRYFEADDLAALPDLLRYSSAGITEKEYRAVWDAPAFFLLLILLKAGEWLLRRRWQSI